MKLELGDYVATDYGDGIIIDIYNGECQIAFEDDMDIYYKPEDITKATHLELAKMMLDTEFRKRYKKLLKVIE
jgi:hypothetical protein